MDNQSQFVPGDTLSSRPEASSTIPTKGPNTSRLSSSLPPTNGHKMRANISKRRAERETEVKQRLRAQALETGMPTASNPVDPQSRMSNIPIAVQESRDTLNKVPKQRQRFGPPRASLPSSSKTPASGITAPWDSLTIDDAPGLKLLMEIMEKDISGEKPLESYEFFAYDSDATDDDPRWGLNGSGYRPRATGARQAERTMQVKNTSQANNNSKTTTTPMSTRNMLSAASKRARTELTTDMLNTDPVLGSRRKPQPKPEPTSPTPRQSVKKVGKKKRCRAKGK
ncbi:hypothetical protein B7494_g3551 [Chlorociboria aeruginascens]|nr:hypothetical protein B7494_g3551 [Chlorociboria aeruginascens]